MKILNRVLVGLILLSVCLINCDKEKENNNFLYVRVSTSDTTYILKENNVNIKSGITFNSDPNEYWLGGIIYDESVVLEGMGIKSLNSTNIEFHNFTLEEITLGSYDFFGNVINNDTIKKGVNIRWMNEYAWEDLMTSYRLTDDYADCVNSYGTNICEQDIRYYNEYFHSSNTKQLDSYFEITKLDHKIFDVERPSCTPSNFQITEMIIEGKFKCRFLSILDSNQVKTIEGDFRVHIPDVEKRLCN